MSPVGESASEVVLKVVFALTPRGLVTIQYTTHLCLHLLLRLTLVFMRLLHHKKAIIQLA